MPFEPFVALQGFGEFYDLVILSRLNLEISFHAICFLKLITTYCYGIFTYSKEFLLNHSDVQSNDQDQILVVSRAECARSQVFTPRITLIKILGCLGTACILGSLHEGTEKCL